MPTPKLDHRELARQMQSATTKAKTPMVKPPADSTLAQLNMQVAQLSDAINAQYLQGGENSDSIDSLRVSVDEVNAAFQTLNLNAGAMLTTHKGQIEALQGHGTKVSTTLQAQAIALEKLNDQMATLATLPETVGKLTTEHAEINKWWPWVLVFTVALSAAAPFFVSWAGEMNHSETKPNAQKSAVQNVRK